MPDADRRGVGWVSTVVAYSVVSAEPASSGAVDSSAWPRRLVGRVLTGQELVSLGAFFTGGDRAALYHDGQTWTLGLRAAGESEHWNAVPHGRDEGEYETEAQVNPAVRRLHIP